MSETKSIFISYRRADSAGHTGRLYDYLMGYLNNIDVFMDVMGIEPGDNWQEVLALNIEKCSIMLVVIGRRWLKIADDHGRRRLDLEDDPVRFEIIAGIRSPNVRVIPVLVDGASVPPELGLPDGVGDLLRANAFHINDMTFTEDAQRLADKIRSYLINDQPRIRRTQKYRINIFEIAKKNKWNWVKLGDIADIRRPQTVKSDVKPGKYPLYNPTGIINEIESYEFEGTMILLPILATSLESGSVQLVNGKFSVTQSLAVIDPHPEVLPGFLWYLLSNLTDKLLNMATGSAIVRVNTRDIRNMPIPLPNIEIQQNIFNNLVDLNDELQQVRDTLKEQIELTYELEVSLANNILKESGTDGR